MSRQGFLSDAEWNEYENELDMVMGVAKWVCSHDPDVLLGYDFHSGSWGFLVERMSTKYKIDISPHLSRILQTKNLWKSVKENSSALDDPNVSKHNRFKQSSHGFLVPNVPGRLVISMWQIARKEYHLQSYSLESVAMHALKQSIPHYPYKTLSRWYKSGPVSFRQRVVSYVCQRTEIVLQLLEKSGVVPRTVEFSMIYGTDYYSTLTRGSQFKVESMMVRISRPENLLMLSPGPTEVKKQPPPSHIPLVLEPQRLFFTDPVVVLDFQSLYPSILIAYNYCYSTCLGKLEDFISNTGNSIRLGFTDYKTVPGLLEQLRDQITVAPNNAVFVKSSVRKSLLSRLLSEVLDTRVMVKEFMKKKSNGPESESLMQQLNSRQLGLKLLSNVVGGYIAASHTGRMPCVDIADAMILTARRTLEHSIKHITANHHRWGGEVIGGDTDSVFIHFPGKTKNQAFEIGAEIAQEITDLNPSPIKLKFERVYKPCIMFAKKRYAGFAFEKPDQKEPIIDCKGIETVQRITCRASHKIIESTLMRVFSGQELHQVKRYLEQQWSRILNGRVSLKDFCIYKSVRPGTYDLERNNKLPAHANVGIQGESSDGRIETGYADRVPFIIAMDQLGLGLSEHSVHPREFFSNPKLKLDAMYYITRLIIPPLDRVFNTIGVDVSLWFDSLSKKKQIGTATIHKLTRDITFSPELLAGGSSFFEDNSKASDKAQDVGDDGNPSNEVSQKTVAIDLPVQPSSDAPNPYQGLKPGPRVLNKKKVGPPKITLDRFYTASHCIVCTNPTKSNSESLCNNCRANPAKSVFLLISQASKFERRQSRLLEICQTCSSGGRMESGSKGSTGSIEIAKSCDNLNCSVLFERIKNGLSAKRSRMILSNALKALE
ncbi:DNA polymerase zeta [Mycoemilia scoparia]|uniref:DNA polymerase zeta catalytic subunit n=1 Tax=Mycoemilia scoparia TaxID=417184 RepID=A0A9W8DV87_9FUNG|nr:DNA polymerase zeta [Mycoemilia scoparia]